MIKILIWFLDLKSW